ncbi:brca1-associated protein [Anaeramoeba flamelloides]|uniref:Brca1-associated protein n=1 Tax=Anaeramoeba flamelloides TaxID=1746091 RepID=A0AAV7ZZ65_9EUKA|nr:brca1-associated protein [Anaeramoeba flamelloides]
MSKQIKILKISRGNPEVSSQEGELFYFENENSSLPKNRKQSIAIIKIPTHIDGIDFLNFIGKETTNILQIYFWNNKDLNDYSVMIEFSDQPSADKFYNDKNEKPFNELEEDLCNSVFVKEIQWKQINKKKNTHKRKENENENENENQKENTNSVFQLTNKEKDYNKKNGNQQKNQNNEERKNKNQNQNKNNNGVCQLKNKEKNQKKNDNEKEKEKQRPPQKERIRKKPQSSDRAYNCPICFESLKHCIVILPCSHRFHLDCLSRWDDNSCPMCRFNMTPPEKIVCDICSGYEQVLLCLICGFQGCKLHSTEHYQQQGHGYGMDLSNQKVWDFVSKSYVHRLILAANNEKIIEIGGDDSNNTNNTSNGIMNNNQNYSQEDDNGLSQLSPNFRFSHQNNLNLLDREEINKKNIEYDQLIETIISSKCESLAIELNNLIIHRLDNQREYFENVIQTTKKSLKENWNEEKKKKLQKIQLKKDSNRKLKVNVQEIREKNKFLENINENLLENQKELGRIRKDVDTKYEKIINKNEIQIHELKNQVNDLMLQLDQLSKKNNLIEKGGVGEKEKEKEKGNGNEKNNENEKEKGKEKEKEKEKVQIDTKVQLIDDLKSLNDNNKTLKLISKLQSSLTHDTTNRFKRSPNLELIELLHLLTSLKLGYEEHPVHKSMDPISLTTLGVLIQETVWDSLYPLSIEKAQELKDHELKQSNKEQSESNLQDKLGYSDNPNIEDTDEEDYVHEKEVKQEIEEEEEGFDDEDEDWILLNDFVL